MFKYCVTSSKTGRQLSCHRKKHLAQKRAKALRKRGVKVRIVSSRVKRATHYGW